MASKEVMQAYDFVMEHPEPGVLIPQMTESPLTDNYKARENSVSINDTFFGDSGKGAVAAKMNRILVEQGHHVVSLGPNGGSNAGHEALIDGRLVVGHQIPMAIAQENATAIISRGKVVHPADLVQEMIQLEKVLGNIPGNLLIDGYAPLALDTHRAFEGLLKDQTTGSEGATGSGISPAYADRYQRIALTMNDLVAEDWEKAFREHYKLYSKLMGGFGPKWNLAEVPVRALDPAIKKHPVGSEEEFIDRMASARQELRPFVVPKIYDFLQETWMNEDIAYSIEYGQGNGLDPWHGIYPDNTASRPLTRDIADPTYGIITPDQIALKMSTMKTLYMSSVGSRKLPTLMDQEISSNIRKEQDERGRTTGRDRGVFEVSLPIAQYMRNVDGYEYLAMTHLDAARADRKIHMVTHYTDKVTGKEAPYLPYQDHIDKLVPHVVEFDGWDGEAVKNVSDPKDLPVEAQRVIAFLSHTIAPVAIGTHGPELGDFISWIPDLEKSIR